MNLTQLEMTCKDLQEPCTKWPIFRTNMQDSYKIRFVRILQKLARHFLVGTSYRDFSIQTNLKQELNRKHNDY